MRFVRFDRAPVVLGAGVLTPCGIGAGSIVGVGNAEDAMGQAVEVDLAGVCGVSKGRFRRMDRYSALGFSAAHLALTAAGWVPEGKADPRWGVVLGSDLGCSSSNALYLRDLLKKRTSELSPAVFARTVPNAVNGEISIAFRIGGVNETFVSGWAAGAEAMIAACTALAEGRVRRVLTGAVEAPDSILRRIHVARRCLPGMDWLPGGIVEAAGICTLAASGGPGDSLGTLQGYGRIHDPRKRWSLAEAIEEFHRLPIGSVIVANTVPSDLARRWRNDANGIPLIELSRLVGELGAAGAPIAVAFSEASSLSAERNHGTLVIARGVDGGTVVLVLGPRRAQC